MLGPIFCCCLHSCESNTRDKLINRFVTLRLDISAKEYAREKRLEFAKKRNGTKSGSRSTTMKRAVE